MTDTFNITIDDKVYEVRDMPIGMDGAFEIWYKGGITVYAGPEENYNIDDGFIRKIGYAIEAHYD